MNYEKKRSRQNGRQGEDYGQKGLSHYSQGYYDGQSELIDRLTSAGILPKVDFEAIPKHYGDKL